MNVLAELSRRIARALADAGAPSDSPALVARATRPEFGDYQANGVMAAAKRMKTNPRELAEKVIDVAKLDDIAEKVEPAGPGFINITLRNDWLASRLTATLGDEQLGVETPTSQTVVVDYSSPNLAKEMHVGHLRSTIIGDALARTLEFCGHNVIRQNHVGDWGTQFGMLIAMMAETGADAADLGDLEQFYQAAKRRFDTDEDFAARARAAVVRMQQGDEGILPYWRRFTSESLKHCEQVYRRLGVSLMREHVRGESSYRDELPQVVTDLESAGLLTESEGAKCVFIEGFTNADDEPLPVIVQKSDGAYLYASTDLAAIRYRTRELKADRILYVTDSRQSLHFRQIFAVARRAGFAGDDVSLEHVGFGMMLGSDHRPFRTRDGGTVRLNDLLDKAEQLAAELVRQRNPELAGDEEALREVSRAVGVGAVKYADLSQNRTSDYVFSWDKMLALDGNTAPYMQYAHARISSIFRRGRDEGVPASGDIRLEHPAERALAVALARFPETIRAVVDDCLPSVLCSYLYELAGAFMGFYENCPVLSSPEPLRTSRLMLCRLTRRTVRTGLELLGIAAPEQM
ncbi:MAG: arginine--tRNA ligase [Phycisphaerae bacterium]